MCPSSPVGPHIRTWDFGVALDRQRERGGRLYKLVLAADDGRNRADLCDVADTIDWWPDLVSGCNMSHFVWWCTPAAGLKTRMYTRFLPPSPAASERKTVRASPGFPVRTYLDTPQGREMYASSLMTYASRHRLRPVTGGVWRKAHDCCGVEVAPHVLTEAWVRLREAVVARWSVEKYQEVDPSGLGTAVVSGLRPYLPAALVNVLAARLL